MNGMPTWHFMRSIPTTEQVFLADRAVAHVLASLAIVVIKEESIDTHAAVVTVAKVLTPSNATKTTGIAMVR